MKEYELYYYTKLGVRRKPSVTNLLLEQKDRIIYNFRRKREDSRRNCNCVYFTDIAKYGMIMATLVNNTSTSIGVVVLDDESFVNELNLKSPEEIPNYRLMDNYRKVVFPSIQARGDMTLERLNAIRKSISLNPSWSYVRPLTEEEFNQPLVIEYVKLHI